MPNAMPAMMVFLRVGCSRKSMNVIKPIKKPNDAARSVVTKREWAMNVGEHGDCLAATAQRVGFCREDGAEFLNIHFNFFKNFSSAVFITGFALTLVLFLVILLINFLSRLFVRQLFSGKGFLSFIEFLEYPLRTKIIRWLALHENSPALI